MLIPLTGAPGQLLWCWRWKEAQFPAVLAAPAVRSAGSKAICQARPTPHQGPLHPASKAGPSHRGKHFVTCLRWPLPGHCLSLHRGLRPSSTCWPLSRPLGVARKVTTVPGVCWVSYWFPHFQLRPFPSESVISPARTTPPFTIIPFIHESDATE